MELKEGMYVRDDKGYISKINWISSQICEGVNIVKATIHLDNDITLIYPDDKFKASNNILDLIEVGDYVNGMRIIAIDSDDRIHVAEDLGQPYDREFSNGCFEYTLLDKKTFKIKSIVTKEQFALMEYEVE